SLAQNRATVNADDHSLRAIGQLAHGTPAETVILWRRGSLAWRKAAYYFPRLPVVVLGRKTLAGPARPTTTRWMGARLVERTEGDPPLKIQLPAGARLIWLLDQKTMCLPACVNTVSLREPKAFISAIFPGNPGARAGMISCWRGRARGAPIDSVLGFAV
ncbi:MAG: hypothetical protein ACPL88_12860, partial [Bryobacteraceae bacterium]